LNIVPMSTRSSLICNEIQDTDSIISLVVFTSPLKKTRKRVLLGVLVSGRMNGKNKLEKKNCLWIRVSVCVDLV